MGTPTPPNVGAVPTDLVKLLKPVEPAHKLILHEILGGWRMPDLTISPNGKAYLHRWHVVPRNAYGNVYLHLQVADDPERPMHDHEYDNQSVILAGGYVEEFWKFPPATGTKGVRTVKAGDVVHRKADEAHRLKLLTDAAGLPDPGYTISLFTTGPRVRDWGFWMDEEHGGRWAHWQTVTEGDYRESGVSKWKEKS
jgi:hypothetical protein